MVLSIWTVSDIGQMVIYQPYRKPPSPSAEYFAADGIAFEKGGTGNQSDIQSNSSQ